MSLLAILGLCCLICSAILAAIVKNWHGALLSGGLALLVLARVAVVTLLACVVLTGCAGEYRNENGPRGPETFTWGTAYPRPLAPCK